MNIYSNSRRGATLISPLDRPLKVTRFPRQSASRKDDLTLSLRELAEVIKDEWAEYKGDLPWLKLARFGNTRSDKGSLRTNANMQAISGIELDYDDGDISPARARAILSEVGIAALIFTTPSHMQPGKGNRWRILCPTSRDLDPIERERLVARINGLFDGAFDPASFTMSQSFYYGNVEDGTPVQTYLVDGGYIDHADDLDEVALGRDGKPYRERREREANDNHEGATRPQHVADSALMSIPNEGDRSWWRDMAAAHKSAGGSFTVFDGWSKGHDSYSRRHTRDTWDDLDPEKEGGITERSLYSAAADHDWRDSELDEQTLADLDDYDADLEALIREDKARAAPVKSRLTVQRPSEITDEEMRRPVIKGLVAEGDIGAIVGSPGVGKSLLAPYMAQAVAQGRSVFGMRVEQGGVLYVPAEDSFGMKQRTRALLKRNGAFEDFQLVSGVSDLLSKDSPDLKDLRRLVKESGCKLVIIDTLAMAFPGLEENSAEGMGRVVAVARSLTKWGAAVILIHHDTKDGQQGLPRGHSLLNGALDVAIHLKRSDDGIIRGKLTKNRNGSCDRDIAFRIGVETLGTDEYGDPVEAAYCDELQALPGEHASRPLSNQTAEALRILKETAGHNDIVSIEAWEEACIASDRFCKPDAKGESRDKAFTRSRMALIEADRIRIKDGDVLILDRRVTATVADFDDDEPPSGNRRRNREIQELV